MGSEKKRKEKQNYFIGQQPRKSARIQSRQEYIFVDCCCVYIANDRLHAYGCMCVYVCICFVQNAHNKKGVPFVHIRVWVIQTKHEYETSPKQWNVECVE